MRLLGGAFAIFYTGTQYFFLRFGAQSDGDPALRLQATTYFLEGAGSAYHTYQLRNDVLTGVTSFWVDGTQFLSEVAVSPDPFNTFSFAWGGGQRPGGSAYANWSEASLSVIPEPSTLVLLSLGGLVLAVTHFRVTAKS